ncbi:P-type ATPase (P-ATPase) Superfamily [Thraustotheca clavata]|uniref:P-type ATPase (P-ATPase) Superfamily n=1 Tax=Thraustotheca clavata TaxID=74557 RepID=A0A1V9YTN7_9STRA|nr:P-type ATPase (P-ATPase) Superfamily [Thraustotheca clavata]
MNSHIVLIDNFKGQLQYQLHYGCNDTEVISIRESNSPSLPQQIGVWHRLQDAIVVETLLQQYDIALTGTGLECLVGDPKYINVIPRLVQETKIFARIKPQMKTWIVQKLMAMGKHVGMTGDGTNDCGALKAAHVGLALSDAEASIVAPFTSRKKDIKDVIDLIKEGRCALMTSLVAFKYMVMYPIIDTTLITVLNHVQASFSNNQYLFDDLIVVLGLSVLMLRTGPSSELSKDRPPNSLFAPSVLWSVAGQTFLFAFYFTIPQLLAHHQSWFCALPDVISGNKTCYVFQPNESGDMTVHSHEVSIVWTTGHLQYLILAFAFNIKDPFRGSAWSNRWFIFYTFVLSILLSIILIEPDNWFNTRWLDLTTPLPQAFCYQVFGLFVSNIAASTLFEHILNKWIIAA